MKQIKTPISWRDYIREVLEKNKRGVDAAAIINFIEFRFKFRDKDSRSLVNGLLNILKSNYCKQRKQF